MVHVTKGLLVKWYVRQTFRTRILVLSFSSSWLLCSSSSWLFCPFLPFSQQWPCHQRIPQVSRWVDDNGEKVYPLWPGWETPLCDGGNSWSATREARWADGEEQLLWVWGGPAGTKSSKRILTAWTIVSLPPLFPNSLSLSLTHTHTHTHFLFSPSLSWSFSI